MNEDGRGFQPAMMLHGPTKKKIIANKKKNAKGEDTTTAAIPNPAQTSMGPRFKTNLVHDRRKKKGFPKLLKRFRDYYQEKGIV